MTEKGPWPDNGVVVDDVGITDWHSGEPRFSVQWSEIDTVSVDVDNYVSGPRPCVAFWMISGHGKSIRLPLMGKPGLDELKQRLIALPGFDHNALRAALEAEAVCKGGEFLCWRR